MAVLMCVMFVNLCMPCLHCSAALLGAPASPSSKNTCQMSSKKQARRRQDAHDEYSSEGAVSERDLPICPENAVCSVLHNRFWMKLIVRRLCRCLKRIECPWEWTDHPDNNTIHLDSRSQLKFCDEVHELPECTQRKPALTVTTTASSGVKDITLTPAVDEEKKLSVNVSCFCPMSFVWEELPLREIIQSPENGTATVITHYKCKPVSINT
ncbi:Kappa-scoloptoxin(11)-Ssd1b [Frankliniella fusca]|uniref:Kappa-scoloptoxin(11)-Ssd1b n=1 Tax=Frankliniella fusca TaxID=407009 RepID=A0AAE1GVL5_9NEOP|nr:Kappa-scoloptoxin(11)-Ssd1b [Frankliniella fusca]